MKFLLALALTVAAAPAAEPPAISAREITSPAGPHAVGVSLTAAPGGTIWMSWVEGAGALPTSGSRSDHHAASAPPVHGGANTLRVATFDAAANKWSPARTIAMGEGLTTSAMDFPQLAIGAAGTAVAVWTDGAGGARFTESRDGGATWSSPKSWSSDGRDMEKFSLVTLEDGRVLAAWLDGRRQTPDHKVQSLYARVVGQPGPDVLVDDSVCDCCPTTLTAFLDGGAMLAYRGRTAEEVRDIRVARFRGDAWDQPRPLNDDGWRITACPVNGPQLASDGGRVAAAWYTAAENNPQVLATYSPDAGARFMLPVRIDRGKPTGQVDTILLHDSAMLVTWLEADGSLWLRRLSPDFAPDEPFSLAAGGNGAVKGIPRAVLLHDYAGGRARAQFLVAFTREKAGATALHTLLVDVPEADLLEAEKNCDCAPSPEQLQGYAMRGTVTEVLANSGSLQVQHFEVPGVFAAGTHVFRAEPEALAVIKAGRQFLGRVERRDGAWHVFDVRLIGLPPPK